MDPLQRPQRFLAVHRPPADSQQDLLCRAEPGERDGNLPWSPDGQIDVRIDAGLDRQLPVWVERRIDPADRRILRDEPRLSVDVRHG